MMKVKTKNIFLVVLSMLFVLTFGCFFVSISAKAQGTTPVTDIVMLEKASVRKETDKSGIRYTAYVNEKHFENGALKDGYKAGVIVTEGQVSANTLTLASNETGGAYAGKVLDIPTTIWDAEKDSEYGKAFNAVVWNIPDTAYGNYLTARAYLFNGTDYIYSDAVCVRNVAQVASEALADGVEDTWGTLVKYVDGVNATITVAGNADETVELTLGLGQSVEVVTDPSYLTLILDNTNAGCVQVKDGKITVTKYDENNAAATVSAKLGSLEKTINIAIVNQFVDSNIAKNVLADFNEANYAYGVYSANSNFYGTLNVLDADTAKTETGANSGVVKVTTRYNWEEVVFKFVETIDVTETAGIYITMKYEAKFEGKMYLRIPKTDGTFAEKAINGTNIRTYKSANGGWNKISIPYAELVRSFAGVTEISELHVMVVPTGISGDECPTLFYVDEIGVVTATGNELLNFDDATDVNMVFQWSYAVTYLAPNATGYPTDVGATTGVVKLDYAAHGSPSEFYFKQKITSNVASAIVLRFYSPVGNKESPRPRVLLNYGAIDLSYKAVVEGAFVDVVFDITHISSATVINSLRIMRYYPTASDPAWYLDSITYVAK